MSYRSLSYPEAKSPVDALARPDALTMMLRSHVDAMAVVAGALAEIDEAASIVATAIRDGAMLYYAAAGSSGLMALADACELPGTFRIPQSQIRICMAGGVPVDAQMPGDTEDDISDATQTAQAVKAGDAVIAISASGTTPYAVAFAEAAKERGAKIISIANVAGSALLRLADVEIFLPVAPEVVSGSTRLGAGTAQKVTLNMISTQVGILLGHVHDGMMVNFNPENIKLRNRAVDVICKIAGVDRRSAETALAESGFDTKMAVLIASGAELSTAATLLRTHSGNMRECLRQINDMKIEMI